MTAYIPGSGLKKPLNMMETPVQADIKKGPPRFLWSKKHWTVDTGRTMATIEHIPEMIDHNVLFQSWDYNKQHAYGKNPSYTTFTNKEFRPPPIDRDDILPLSRIPRPTIVPHLNPGAAHPSGNNAFAEQNMHLPQVEGYISDRVKSGELRPTFFCPIENLIDNSVLPDLELKLPSVSATAGFRFNDMSDLDVPERELEYKQVQTPVATYIEPIYKSDNINRDYKNMEYKTPQVSAVSGYNGMNIESIENINYDLDYNAPQVSAHSGYSGFKGVEPNINEHELYYNNPQVSGYAGKNTFYKPREEFKFMELEQKLEGNQPYYVQPQSNYKENNQDKQQSSMNLTNKHQITYSVPKNTFLKSDNGQNNRKIKEKMYALSQNQKTQNTQSALPQIHRQNPNVHMKLKY